MKHIRRFNESQAIKAIDATIKEIVKEEINKLGNKADLNHIDVSEITKMNDLFIISKFNGDISLWNTENVKDMESMFYESIFNGDISLWNVGNVRDMENMFQRSKFNGDISLWNLESVKSMESMFNRSQFNGNLNKWKPKSLRNSYETFHKSPLEGKEPIWFLCLKLGLFKSGEDYCDSLKYDWFREGTIFIGRLELALELFDGNLSKIDRIKKLSHFNIQN